MKWHVSYKNGVLLSYKTKKKWKKACTIKLPVVMFNGNYFGNCDENYRDWEKYSTEYTKLPIWKEKKCSGIEIWKKNHIVILFGFLSLRKRNWPELCVNELLIYNWSCDGHISSHHAINCAIYLLNRYLMNRNKTVVIDSYCTVITPQQGNKRTIWLINIFRLSLPSDWRPDSSVQL